MAKLFAVMVHGGRPLFGVVRIACQNLPTGDQAAIHLIQPDFVTKLALFARLLAPDDGAMGFKEVDDFLGGRDDFPLENAAHGLVKHLLDAGQKGLHGGHEALRRLAALAFACGDHALGLSL
jgi:hypothetical protein